MKLFLSDILNLGDGFNLRCVFIRGGNWNNTSNTGAFTLNLNWTTSNTNNNVGFRCASDRSNSSHARQNEQYISTDLYSGFKRSQNCLHHMLLAYENIKPVFLHSISSEHRVNRLNLDKGRGIEPALSLSNSRR